MTTWPDEVTVVKPGMVGRHKFSHADNSPCCAYGWLGYEVYGDPELWSAPDFVLPFQVKYQACAKQLTGVAGRCVTDINDDLGQDDRALLVNATWAALGYVVGQNRKAIALARKAGFDV